MGPDWQQPKDGEFYIFPDDGDLVEHGVLQYNGSIPSDCMPGKPRVLLADDHQAFVKELGAHLEPEFDIVGIVNDGQAALEAAHALRPDVIVLDIKMPVMGGIDAARRLFEDDSDARMVFLSSYQSPALVREALATGAMGYVFKCSVVEDLGQAICAALAGETFVSSNGPGF